MAKNKNDRAIKMLATALDMEKKGETFYEKAMNECKTEPGKGIFRMLMADEIIHYKRIKKIYDSLEAGLDWADEWKLLEVKTKQLGTFFKKITDKHGSDIKSETTDLEAMDVGIDLELQAVKFYEAHLTKATDQTEREFLMRMISEERGHYRALSDMKFYLIDPVSWFRDKERTGLEG
ncbi:MAG: ferritin family protein [Kiritimatiellaceae bacterium]|nr:ferritin family protein [Kiritimatiellaceae bacterium]